MRRTYKYVRTAIAEPFPLFHKPGQADSAGPFYARDSEWFVPYSAANLRWKEDSAEALRADGFTVTVDIVER